MANAIRWEVLPTKVTVIDLGTTLADATLSSFDSTNGYNNGTNLFQWAYFVLTTSTGDLYTAAPTAANANARLYMARKFDGTNLENTPVTADVDEFPHLLVPETFPIATEVTNVPLGMRTKIQLPPFELEFALYNDSGQTMGATWQVDMYPAADEIQ